MKLPPLQNVHKKSITEQLLEITPDYSNRRVAELIAERCVEMTDAPYRFAINHDVRPPKNLACPLHYDWTRRDRVGINTDSKRVARRWLVNAAVRGYTIFLEDTRKFTISDTLARCRAARHQMPKGDDDDDVPF